MTEEIAPPKTYRGNCHCGSFVYTLTVPEITKVSSCDCSICSKKAALWTVVTNPGEQFKIVKGDEENDLTTYKFASQAFLHKFCKKCGSALFTRWPTGPPEKQMVLNTRCLQDFDTWDIPTTTFPGSTLGSAHKPPTFDGPEPVTSELKDPKIYYGSCHCGDVKLAYKTEPLNEATRVVDCNCSIDRRNGTLWTYPKRDQVVITGADSLTTYSHGLHVFVKTFCTRCGILIQNAARDLSAEELSEFPAAFATFYESAKPLQPVNLRVLDGFDLAMVKPEKVRGWDLIEPKYVNP